MIRAKYGIKTYTESRKRHGAAAVIPAVMVTRGEAHTYNRVSH